MRTAGCSAERSGDQVPQAIYCSRSFLEDHSSFQASFQQLIEGAVKDLIRRVRAKPKDWMRQYDTVKGLKRRVVEVDVSGGDRLLALVDDHITLWRVGNHDLISKVVKNRPDYPNDQLELPVTFLPEHRSRLFPEGSPLANSLAQLESFVNENSREWVYQLAPEQSMTAGSIFDDVFNKFLDDDRYIATIVGGPGTGKTAILVWLLKKLTDFDSDGLKLKVRLKMSSQVLRQIRDCTGWNLDPFLYEKNPDVVLIDDPAGLREIDEMIARWESASIIAAFDVLQMKSDVNDKTYFDWNQRHDVSEHTLSVCYRQKRKVGKAARAVFDQIASSSPFLDERKQEEFFVQHFLVAGLSNELKFANPDGHYSVISEDGYPRFLKWLQSYHEEFINERLWTHTVPLLVAVDDCLVVSQIYEELLEGFPNVTVRLSRSEDVKGVDFQHGLIFLSRRTFTELNEGFEGKGQKTYANVRLMRIPFSRPKDTLTVFVFD